MQEFLPAFDVRLNSRPTYWHCEPGWEWKSRPLPDHLLWYVLDGVGIMRVEQRQWELRAGSCFVFVPGEQPHGMQDPERRLVVFGMHFNLLDQQARLLLETSALLPPYGQVVHDTLFFTTLAQRCDASFRRGDQLGVYQSRLFLRAILLHLLEEYLNPAPSAVEVALDEIIRMIQHEPGLRWNVDTLAHQAHLSRAQFVRRFRAVAGLSPVRFMIHARLERARQLIQETNMTLEQIAAALGYTDVGFFCRQYKHYAGSAPGALRRRM